MTTTPIERLFPYLPTRTYNGLRRAEKWGPAYTTVEELENASDAALLERRNTGPKSVAEIRDAVDRLRRGVPPAGPAHEARRGSDVEAWLKRWRDAFALDDPEARKAYVAFDAALDDYRDHADTGTPLDQEVQGPHPEE
jgi:hypothetical protein